MFGIGFQRAGDDRFCKTSCTLSFIIVVLLLIVYCSDVQRLDRGRWWSMEDQFVEASPWGERKDGSSKRYALFNINTQ